MKKILIVTLLVFSASVLCKEGKTYEKWKQSMRDHYFVYSGGEKINEGMLTICHNDLIRCIEEGEEIPYEILRKGIKNACFTEADFCVDMILMHKSNQ